MAKPILVEFIYYSMRTFLFLHGWGGNSDSFAPISRYFARDLTCRVFVPNLPCPPQKVYTLEDYADDVDKLLYQNKITRCVVIAHSFGARLVAILNARHPHLFTQVIITGGAGLSVGKSWRVRWKIWWYKLGRRLGWRVQGGSADYRRLDENGKKTFQNIIHRDLSLEVKQIHAPTLLVWGSRDCDTPLKQMKRWCTLIPHAQKIIYRGKSHFAYLEESARFINDMNNFLASHQGAQ